MYASDFCLYYIESYFLRRNHAMWFSLFFCGTQIDIPGIQKLLLNWIDFKIHSENKFSFKYSLGFPKNIWQCQRHFMLCQKNLKKFIEASNKYNYKFKLSVVAIFIMHQFNFWSALFSSFWHFFWSLSVRSFYC